MATGVPVWEIEPALGLLVGGLLAAGIYPVIRRMGARAEQGKNILKEANRGWGDSFQVACVLGLMVKASALAVSNLRLTQSTCLQDMGLPECSHTCESEKGQT